MSLAALQEYQTLRDPHNKRKHDDMSAEPIERSYEIILEDIIKELEKHQSTERLLSMSAGLVQQIDQCCKGSAHAMLPSFVKDSRIGSETGNFLCLDIGGSTLRAALVSLRESNTTVGQSSTIMDVRSWAITKELKGSSGKRFLGWIASTVAQMLRDSGVPKPREQTDVRASLTWSFPFEYVVSKNLSFSLSLFLYLYLFLFSHFFSF